MFTKVLMMVSLVIFVVFYILKLTGNFHHTVNGVEVEYEWIWVFSPLLFFYAYALAINLRLP